MRNFEVKPWMIITVVAIAFILCLIGGFASTHNHVVGLEEQINTALANIETQEKRRVDLIYNLVDTVESYNQYEQETMTAIVEARQSAASGNVEEAQLTIQALAEAYPELKSNENYQTLMTELALTENIIAENRNNYNTQVKNYNRYVRRFPANIVLGIIGYEPIDAEYLEFDAPSDAPQNLFGED
jgi:LemA protein